MSSNYLFNYSKDVRDYKQKMRIQFSGGWDDRNSPIFQWYHLQPNSKFRTIEYRKDREGVQHEYILILLEDRDGHQLDSYCRLERVADPAHRIEAIGADGTTAFDLIQTVDLNQPSPTTPEQDWENSELVARITFPRVFDLLDLLAICFGIYNHPRAMRYTLQQFNCYFFSWTIILCLARRAFDWECNFHYAMNEIHAAIIKHVEDIRLSRKFTVWSLLFRMHDAPETYTLPSSIDGILKTISSESFLDLVKKLLDSLFWYNQDSKHFESMLGGYFDKAILYGIDPGLGCAHLWHEPRTWDTLLSSLSLNRIGRTFELALYRHNHTPRYEQTQLIKQYYNECFNQAPLDSRMKILGSRALMEIISIPIVTWYLISLIPFCLWLYPEIYHQKKVMLGNCAIQGPLAAAKAILSIPHHYYNLLIHFVRCNRLTLYCSLSNHIHEARLDAPNIPFPTVPDATESWVSVLNESLMLQNERDKEATAEELRQRVVGKLWYLYSRGPLSLLTGNSLKTPDSSMAGLWQVTLRMELGRVVSQAVIDNIVKPMSEAERQLELITGNDFRVQSRSPPELKYISHAKIQDKIRERICRLSRKEVEQVSIAKYVSLTPFTTPPRQSQKEIENAIQEIWNYCRPLMS